MKGKFLFFCALMLVGLFTVAMFVNIGQISLRSIWFSVALLCIGIYSLLYSHMYKLDSCLYFGILNICFAFATAFRFLLAIKFGVFYPIYFICFAIAHLAVFVIFRQNIHFKLFAILSIEGILLISYKAKFLNLWLVIAVNAIFLLFVLSSSIYRLRKNLRRG